MCIKCEKIFRSLSNINPHDLKLKMEEVKKIPYIQTNFIEDKYGKWYRCYCRECGNTVRLYV